MGALYATDADLVAAVERDDGEYIELGWKHGADVFLLSAEQPESVSIVTNMELPIDDVVQLLRLMGWTVEPPQGARAVTAYVVCAKCLGRLGRDVEDEILSILSPRKCRVCGRAVTAETARLVDGQTADEAHAVLCDALESGAFL